MTSCTHGRTWRARTGPLPCLPGLLTLGGWGSAEQASEEPTLLRSPGMLSCWDWRERGPSYPHLATGRWARPPSILPFPVSGGSINKANPAQQPWPGSHPDHRPWYSVPSLHSPSHLNVPVSGIRVAEEGTVQGNVMKEQLSLLTLRAKSRRVYKIHTPATFSCRCLPQDASAVSIKATVWIRPLGFLQSGLGCWSGSMGQWGARPSKEQWMEPRKGMKQRGDIGSKGSGHVLLKKIGLEGG